MIVFEPTVTSNTFVQQVYTAHFASVVHKGWPIIEYVQTVWARVLFVQPEFHEQFFIQVIQ